MNLNDAKKRIQAYLCSNKTWPLLVDVQTKSDKSEIIDYFKVGENTFPDIESFCNDDGDLKVDELYAAVSANVGNTFITNVTGFLKLHGELATKRALKTFVEKRVNLIELAPKGTGKSYVFGHVSKYGLLVDGGKITRTKMFYDANRRKPGYICGPDFLAIDEVKLVNFGDENEMRSILQGYLEYGTFNANGYNGESDAGVVFLGNIKEEKMNEYEYMLGELPTLFQETALLDRIHGFVKGWDIPRMNDSLKVTGWALNSEYFCSILHELRNDMSYSAILHRLDLMGICVSTGSACDSVSTQISHVLKAIKLEDNYARGTIRISFGKENTFEEADIIAESLIRILKK